MHPIHPRTSARARTVALAALGVLLALPVGAAEGRLVDETAPGEVTGFRVTLDRGRAMVEAQLPSDDDVVQVRFAFLDPAGATLQKHYAPAGPGEQVRVALPIPTGSARLAARVVDGAGNPGPESSLAVDGSLEALTLQRDAPLLALVAAAALGTGALAAPRRR